MSGLHPQLAMRQSYSRLLVHGFFVFQHSGEFTVVSGVNQTLLSVSDIQVDSRQDPTYVAIILRGSKTGPLAWDVHCLLDAPTPTSAQSQP